MTEIEEPWRPSNYYNYFTEVEEHFQRARGSAWFSLSSLDWATVAMWKDAGIPLEAVVRGIDSAFDKWRSKKKRGREVNGLAYCVQAVIDEAEAMAGAATTTKGEAAAPFTLEELRGFLEAGLAELRRGGGGCEDVCQSLEAILAELERHHGALESLERQLSGLEDKMLAVARVGLSTSDLAQARADLDRELAPYRGKMTAPQLLMLEKQYLDRWVFERGRLPRLSLFYLR
jgi:hypothetical protein